MNHSKYERFNGSNNLYDHVCRCYTNSNSNLICACVVGVCVIYV